MRNRSDRPSTRRDLRVRPTIDSMEPRCLLSTTPGRLKAAQVAHRAMLHELRAAASALVTDAAVTEGPLVQVSGPSPFLLAGFPGEPVNYPNSAVEPRLAVDPTNPNHLVGVWQQDRYDDDGAHGTVSAVSFDGGQTWKESIVPGLTLRSLGPYQRASDPYVAFGALGQVYTSSVVFNEKASGGQSAVYTNISTNGGKSWHLPAVVTSLPSVSSQTDKDAIAADPKTPGLAYAAWENLGIPATFIGFRGPAEFARTVDGGRTWQAPQTLYDPGPNAITINNTPLVAPGGTVYDAFTLLKTTANGFVNKLNLLTSRDKGQTFTAAPIQGPTLLGTPVTDPDNGAPVRTSSAPSGLPAQFADVTVDPTNGNLYAVWQDARYQLGQYDDIVFSASTDGGLTWSTPIPINQTPSNIPFADRQAFDPTIAVAADGTIGVSYYDFRNNTADLGAKTDAWFVSAPAGSNPTQPASWANEVRLTTSSFNIETAPSTQGGYFLGDYAGLAVSGDTFTAFFSTTNGTDKTDVFARTITVA